MRLSSPKVHSVWKRFAHEATQWQTSAWLEPSGFTTNVKVYNPITKCKVPLIIKHEKLATWYMCGPTVYDSAHIGHACTYVRFDIIRRILAKFFDIDAVTVMGVTDIDDKIIKRSAESKIDWRELTRHYEAEFCGEMKLLNVKPPYLYCRVSDYVPQIVGFVEKMLSTKAAYVGKDGSIYFDTRTYEKYGKLCRPSQSENHPLKHSTTDFALWKASRSGEPFWESSFGPGRPGWHVECSAIASAVLGDSMDIHSGGVDLLFPHHENEEAQSCCYHGVDQWVNYWLHSGHLHLKGDEKMSKSLRNTINIRELLNNYSANQFRLFCLLTHYRTGIEFSHERMQSAVTILGKLENFLSDCRNYASGRLDATNIDENLVVHTLKITREKVYAALADDFDTTNAVFAIQELVSVVNKMINQPEATKTNVASKTSCIAAVAEYIKNTLSDLGFSDGIIAQGSQDQLTKVVDTLVNFRCLVRKRALRQTLKDTFLLETCDKARDDLLTCGVKIKDHKTTSTWTFSEDSKTGE